MKCPDCGSKNIGRARARATKFEIEMDLLKKDRLEFLNDLKKFLDRQSTNYIVRLLGNNMILLNRKDLE